MNLCVCLFWVYDTDTYKIKNRQILLLIVTKSAREDK